jgi:hypothetical protein
MKKKDKKYNYKIVLGIIVGILLSATAVYATTTYIGSGTELSYDNSKSKLNSTNIQNALDELYEKICPDGYVCVKKPNLALGDYVSLTPTKSSYTTDTSMTGYDSTQTIYPQELNLWRVISLNDDGTVDIISEHVSSVRIFFKGQTGYQNFVGYLNVLASQYENSDYTVGSRHFGYNGQTEYITDTSKFTNPAPWTCSITTVCVKSEKSPVESQGGGDTLYEKDYYLVKSFLGTTAATKPGGGTSGSWYWIASRYYLYHSETYYIWYGRDVSASDNASYSYLYGYEDSNFSTGSNSQSLRPILTLKSGLEYEGDGTSDSPLIPIKK